MKLKAFDIFIVLFIILLLFAVGINALWSLAALYVFSIAMSPIDYMSIGALGIVTLMVLTNNTVKRVANGRAEK